MTKAELDLEVAVRVMGLSRITLKKVPKYSSDLNEAMKVVDVMRARGLRWLIVISDEGYFLRNLVNVTHNAIRDEKVYTADRPLSNVVSSKASDLPKLICEAALQEIK